MFWVIPSSYCLYLSNTFKSTMGRIQNKCTLWEKCGELRTHGAWPPFPDSPHYIVFTFESFGRSSYPLLTLNRVDEVPVLAPDLSPPCWIIVLILHVCWAAAGFIIITTTDCCIPPLCNSSPGAASPPRHTVLTGSTGTRFIPSSAGSPHFGYWCFGILCGRLIGWLVVRPLSFWVWAFAPLSS